MFDSLRMAILKFYYNVIDKSRRSLLFSILI